MKDAGMSDNSEEFVNAGPRNGPGEGSFGKRFQNLKRRAMMLARANLSVNQDVGVNRLHGLGSIHKIEERISVQQVDPGKFSSLPAPKAQPVSFPRACHQGAAKKIIDNCLKGSAFLGGFFLQFEEKLILDRQSGSPHMQKHTSYASRCQEAYDGRARLAVLFPCLSGDGGRSDELVAIAVASRKTAKVVLLAAVGCGTGSQRD